MVRIATIACVVEGEPHCPTVLRTLAFNLARAGLAVSPGAWRLFGA